MVNINDSPVFSQSGGSSFASFFIPRRGKLLNQALSIWKGWQGFSRTGHEKCEAELVEFEVEPASENIFSVFGIGAKSPT